MKNQLSEILKTQYISRMHKSTKLVAAYEGALGFDETERYTSSYGDFDLFEIKCGVSLTSFEARLITAANRLGFASCEEYLESEYSDMTSSELQVVLETNESERLQYKAIMLVNAFETAIHIHDGALTFWHPQHRLFKKSDNASDEAFQERIANAIKLLRLNSFDEYLKSEYAEMSMVDLKNVIIGHTSIYKPGDEVWVVIRENGKPVDIGCFMFMAKCNDAIIATSYINDLETIEETVAYHIEETELNMGTDFCVFPAKDCFRTEDEAKIWKWRASYDNNR